MAARKDDYQLHEVLKKVFGFDSFKGNQEAIIQNVLAEKIRLSSCPPAEENLCATSCRH